MKRVCYLENEESRATVARTGIFSLRQPRNWLEISFSVDRKGIFHNAKNNKQIHIFPAHCQRAFCVFILQWFQSPDYSSLPRSPLLLTFICRSLLAFLASHFHAFPLPDPFHRSLLTPPFICPIPLFIHPSLPKGVLLCSYLMCGNVSNVRGQGQASQTACEAVGSLWPRRLTDRQTQWEAKGLRWARL